MRAEIRDNPIIHYFYDEGRQEGKAGLLLKQLRKRFGKLPEWVSAYLERAKAKEIDAAALRLLEAASLEEVFPMATNGVKKARRK